MTSRETETHCVGSYSSNDGSFKNPILVLNELIWVEAFTNFKPSVEKKQALNSISIPKLTRLKRNNSILVECFSGVQLGHVQLLNFKEISTACNFD